MLFHLCYQVSGHGQEEQAVVEGQGGRRASRDGDADAHDVPEVEVFRHEGVEDEALNEEGDRDDVKDKDVEDVLSVLLEEGREGVPFLEQGMLPALGDRVETEALHPGNVRGRVQVVLFGALAIKTDGKEITLEFLHHGLEIVV